MDASSSNHGVSCAPYLTLKHAAGSNQPIFYIISEKKIDAEDEDELTNNNCWATPQGWILVRDVPSSTTYVVYPHNTTDMWRIPLQHLQEENLSTYCTCLLSDYPADDPGQTSSSSSSCIVVLVETDAPVIWYCRIDGKEWTRHEYDIGTLDYDCRSEKIVISPIAACRGKFYFNGGGFKDVSVLEFCPAPSFSSVVIRNAITGPKGYRKVFKVESEQELYKVSLMLSYRDLDVVHRFSVHKMDFAEDEWRGVDDIGDRAFLLSSWYFGASRSADECGLERSCLYMVYMWKRRLMVFNLRDRTMKVQELDGAPASDQALWMLPTQP